MSDIGNAYEALVAACGVTGVRVYRTETLAQLVPPGVVISPPTINWETFNPGPTSVQFTVWVVGLMNDYSIGDLIDNVVAVQAAIEAQTPATVTTAVPTTLEITGRLKGAADFPAYTMVVEYPL
jgi:hypothetical protein